MPGGSATWDRSTLTISGHRSAGCTAALASFQTFFGYGQRAAKHRGRSAGSQRALVGAHCAEGSPKRARSAGTAANQRGRPHRCRNRHVARSQVSSAPAAVQSAVMPGAELGLAGHVALVTGAAGGIGRACAEQLAAAGATVVADNADLQQVTAVQDFPSERFDDLLTVVPALHRRGHRRGPGTPSEMCSAGTTVSRSSNRSDGKSWTAVTC